MRKWTACLFRRYVGIFVGVGLCVCIYVKEKRDFPLSIAAFPPCVFLAISLSRRGVKGTTLRHLGVRCPFRYIAVPVLNCFELKNVRRRA